MNCDVVRLVAVDEVLGSFSCRVVDIALDPHVGGNFLDDNATNAAGLGVPFNVISAFEYLRHGIWKCPPAPVAAARRRSPAKQRSTETHYHKQLQHRVECSVRGLALDQPKVPPSALPW